MAKKDKEIDKFLKFKFSLAHRINMYERLGSYVEEGFPVFDSLTKFKQRYEKRRGFLGKSGGDFRGKIIGSWLDKIKRGSSFGQAISGWVPDAEMNLIISGESSGGLDKGLSEAAKFATSASKIKNTIIGGATYPVVLMFAIIGFIVMFNKVIASTYLGILELEKWPILPQMMYVFSSLLIDNWVIFTALFGVLVFIITKTMGTWTGSLREIADKMPPWSIYKTYQACAFLIALASMMKSGVPLNDALIKIKKISSDWLANYIDDMLQNLKRGGKNFGAHLNVGLLDEETAGDVIDYSELGRFETAIYSLGEKNLEKSVKRIESQMVVVRNIMLVIVGLSIGAIYYANVELNGAAADHVSTSTVNRATGASGSSRNF